MSSGKFYSCNYSCNFSVNLKLAQKKKIKRWKQVRENSLLRHLHREKKKILVTSKNKMPRRQNPVKDEQIFWEKFKTKLNRGMYDVSELENSKLLQSIILKFIFRLNQIAVKIPYAFLVKNDKLTHKFIQNAKTKNSQCGWQDKQWRLSIK